MRLNEKSKLKAHSGRLIVRLFLILFLILEAYPFMWNLMSSFKTNTEFMTNPMAFPRSLAWDNYVRAYVKSNLGDYIWNSFFVTALTLVFTLVMAVPSAYCLSRYRFFGSGLILGFFMTAMFISGNYIIIPLFLQMKDLHILNNLVGISVVYATFQLPQSIFLLSGFMRDIPRDYEEAASLDGCGPFRVLKNIIIPLSRAGISTISLLTVMSAFNEYPIALVALTDERKRTLSVGLANLFQIQQYATDWGALFAALVLAMIPTIILFLVCENQLLKGISVGGIKG